ncbi:beta-1,6-N-acetylglucosaminyltransferase [Rhizobium sp. PL01]|uniref:beta-1,6-N-acetylglucosaminyltransferase n=1 Tax=Rhizobium sp. PL01 TaxID=3085631 RepID=UPI002980C9A5|nr:beta-1,6-N-acetylglucosaminyltransferase [Rhizobium sp. PL01]MDW5317165.1 beta-1,6-N-acetylglucosaminyltransferase [Rhizobium sp. PL01]
MIGYLILVHRFPEQFKRLFKAIYDPLNSYVVHVDKNSGAKLDADLRDFLEPYSNAEVMEGRAALWGGYSLVDAELRGMEHLLAMDRNWSHFINLSGQDFPLKTQHQIMAQLSAYPNREYIKVFDQKNIRPDTMRRVGEFVIERGGHIEQTLTMRPFLDGATPYIGNQWMIVSRAFCDFVCNDVRADRYKAFYRNTFIADEGFFQTVMMNTQVHGEIVNDDLRMIDWVPDGDIKLRPRTYLRQDAAELKASHNFFARKFDQDVDGDILSILEGHLARQTLVTDAEPDMLSVTAA